MANNLCADCSHRNECGVSSMYVRTCANYEFLKCMSTASLCPTCLYQKLCLKQNKDAEITECSSYKKQ